MYFLPTFFLMIYFLNFILHSNISPSHSSSHIPLHSPQHTPHPLHPKGRELPRGVNKFQLITLREDHVPPTCIKAEHDVPLKGMCSNKLAHAPEVGPGPTSRGPSDRTSLTTVSHIWRAFLDTLEAPQLSVQSS